MTADSAVHSAQGEDRSSYQPVASWKGLDFGFAKVTEGTGWSDPNFAANWANMEKDGLELRGAYHFFHPSQDPIAQARFFVSTVRQHGLRPGDALAADVEILTGLGGRLLIDEQAAARSHLAMSGPTGALQWRSGTAPPDTSALDLYGSVGSAARTFLDEVATLAGPHCPVLIYTNESVGATLGACIRYPLWIALPGNSAPAGVSPWGDWAFWQWGWSSGLNGGDSDAFNGTRAALAAWKAGYMPKPQPKPQPPPPQPKPQPTPPPKDADMSVAGQIPASLKKADITYPDGCTVVRFFCSMPAKIEVDLRDKKPWTQLELGYTGTKSVKLPAGIDGIVVHVQEPARDGTPISYVVW